jgi:hypothetical protein
LPPKVNRGRKLQLGKHANACSVYVHVFGREIIYVGKTTKEKRDDGKISWATFGERLRREFQESSSQNSNLHQLLASYKSISTVMFSLDKIDQLIKSKKISSHRKALILEQILIALFSPIGNRI